VLLIVCFGLPESWPGGIYTLAAEEFCFDGKDDMDLLMLARHVLGGRLSCSTQSPFSRGCRSRRPAIAVYQMLFAGT
jgi:hypothetical protein